MHGSPWCQKLPTAFGYFYLTSMKLYIGLNVKIIIDILNFYFYFISKEKFTPKLVWLIRVSLNFSKSLTSV